MTEIPSPPDISDDEAVLRMFGNPPGHKFYGNDRTPDSIPPSRGWLSTIRSDLPTTFRVVDTIWPSLTSAINTYIEVSATEADVDGPLGHLSAIIERLAGSFSGQRLGSTGPDLDRDVMSPVNEAIHEIHASRHPGQEAHGPPASLLWWGDLSPQARVLPAPPTFSLRKSTCSEHGPVLATAEILSYDFLPIGLIDRIDSCLAHPSTFVDDEGLVQCKLGSCVVAGAVISRVSEIPFWFTSHDSPADNRWYGIKCHRPARLGVSCRTPSTGGSSRPITRMAEASMSSGSTGWKGAM